MAGIFARIASGEIPSYKIAEDERFFAFLDINPLAKGHTLVIPKQEIDYLFDMNEEMHKDLWQFTMKVAKAIKQVVPCIKVGVKRFAIIMPREIITEMSVSQAAEEAVNLPIEINYFRNETEALMWLDLV